MPFLSRSRLERVLAGLLAVQLSAGVTGAWLLQPEPQARRAAGAVVRGRVDVGRAAAVQALLDARAKALLNRDRAGFLAAVDPTQAAFVARQGALFDALRDVPLARWEYDIDATAQRAHTAALDRLRGAWWSPDVTLRYALAGFDREATTQRQGLTFVARDGRWLIAADDDFARDGNPTARDLWDGGPVVVSRGRSCLVLAHPGRAQLMAELVRECDAAVPRVTAVWGRSWSQRVVLMLPKSAAEIGTIVPDAGDLTQIAAVATAELLEPLQGYHPVGDRVLVNPATYTQLGALGRRIVLTHEVMHVATRPVTGPRIPTWFVEGLADYVGYLGAHVPLAVATQELRHDLRKGRLPKELPDDASFAGVRPDLPQIYEQSWLAVVLMAKTYGQDAMLRVYRQAGTDPLVGAFDRAVQDQLHTTVAKLTAAWLADLQQRVA